MKKENILGNWNQLKGRIKEQWGKLTDDDLTKMEGKRDQLIGKLQERYGYAKEQAEREIDAWEARLQDTEGCGCHDRGEEGR